MTVSTWRQHYLGRGPDSKRWPEHMWIPKQNWTTWKSILPSQPMVMDWVLLLTSTMCMAPVALYLMLFHLYKYYLLTRIYFWAPRICFWLRVFVSDSAFFFPVMCIFQSGFLIRFILVGPASCFLEVWSTLDTMLFHLYKYYLLTRIYFWAPCICFWLRVFVSGSAYLFLTPRFFFRWRVFFNQASWYVLSWLDLLHASWRSDRH